MEKRVLTVLKRKKKKTLNFVYAVFTFMFAYEGMVAMTIEMGFDI